VGFSTVYDPTCGSGSLLLKVADEARTPVTLYGQEKDSATSGLARMNMILHDNATADIRQGNTLANPKFEDGGTLKIFDYVVANPPFSDKSWVSLAAARTCPGVAIESRSPARRNNGQWSSRRSTRRPSAQNLPAAIRFSRCRRWFWRCGCQGLGR
jgi:type I restriction-modification system DNA methylase subunit